MVPDPGSEFPTDETTLTLLIAACRINPDTGQTHLQDFLDMGSRVKSVEQIEWSDPPVFLVEHEPGYEPFSEQQVIIALARELLELRQKEAASREALKEIADGDPVCWTFERARLVARAALVGERPE